jgi:hypothetical protein
MLRAYTGGNYTDTKDICFLQELRDFLSCRLLIHGKLHCQGRYYVTTVNFNNISF